MPHLIQEVIRSVVLLLTLEQTLTLLEQETQPKLLQEQGSHQLTLKHMTQDILTLLQQPVEV